MSVGESDDVGEVGALAQVSVNVIDKITDSDIGSFLCTLVDPENNAISRATCQRDDWATHNASIDYS